MGELEDAGAYLEGNLAAPTATTLTCSSAIMANFGARHALPGAKNMDFWLANSEAPGWLCAEFEEAKVIGRVQVTMFRGHSEGCNFQVDLKDWWGGGMVDDI